MQAYKEVVRIQYPEPAAKLLVAGVRP